MTRYRESLEGVQAGAQRLSQPASAGREYAHGREPSLMTCADNALEHSAQIPAARSAYRRATAAWLGLNRLTE